MPKIGRK